MYYCEERKDNSTVTLYGLFFMCSLHLKEEAHDFLEENTVKDLVKKYSQFINFPIYIWASKVGFNYQSSKLHN